mmetsp:Transcript_3629/g.12085  ORF Transcript_3629/g.12085 Transcript_3629/m.12085 type:complete len:221 (-) Transcript_3629:24-686(-)
MAPARPARRPARTAGGRTGSPRRARCATSSRAPTPCRPARSARRATAASPGRGSTACTRGRSRAGPTMPTTGSSRPRRRTLPSCAGTGAAGASPGGPAPPGAPSRRSWRRTAPSARRLPRRLRTPSACPCRGSRCPRSGTPLPRPGSAWCAAEAPRAGRRLRAPRGPSWTRTTCRWSAPSPRTTAPGAGQRRTPRAPRIWATRMRAASAKGRAGPAGREL